MILPIAGVMMTKSRILVVDDEPNLSALVRLFLEKTQRFEVCVENRSARALTTAREFRPEMILLDVDMPGKDGGEIALEMELDSELRKVPILFLTSLISRAVAGERETLRGRKRFLAKPVNARVLVQTVDRLLAGASYCI
jgi:DNA-binding response OmpR family regulator